MGYCWMGGALRGGWGCGLIFCVFLAASLGVRGRGTETIIRVDLSICFGSPLPGFLAEGAVWIVQGSGARTSRARTRRATANPRHQVAKVTPLF